MKVVVEVQLFDFRVYWEKIIMCDIMSNSVYIIQFVNISEKHPQNRFRQLAIGSQVSSKPNTAENHAPGVIVIR